MLEWSAAPPDDGLVPVPLLGQDMAFTFDEHTEPEIEDGRQSIRFCMIDGRTRATCQIGYTTLSDLAGQDVETGEESLIRFQMYRSSITTAAARLLAAGAHEGGSILQIMRANLL